MSFLNGEYSNANGHIKPSPPPPPLQEDEEANDQDISITSDDTTPGCEIYSQLGELDTGDGGHTSIFFGGWSYKNCVPVRLSNITDPGLGCVCFTQEDAYLRYLVLPGIH